MRCSTLHQYSIIVMRQAAAQYLLRGVFDEDIVRHSQQQREQEHRPHDDDHHDERNVREMIGRLAYQLLVIIGAHHQNPGVCRASRAKEQAVGRGLG